jgi:hypothetical protein
MGVEYRQFLMVKDLDWLPSADATERVDAVLQKWEVAAGIESTVDFPSGAATLYQWSTDDVAGEFVERLAGPALYGDGDPASRYIQGIALLIGSDFHVHPSSDSVNVDVETGPIVEGVEVLSTECEEANFVIFETFPHSGSGSHPVMDVSFAMQEPVNGPFAGTWRAALIIDYGKSLPESADESPLIHNREFAHEISLALGAELIECGEVY